MLIVEETYWYASHIRVLLAAHEDGRPALRAEEMIKQLAEFRRASEVLRFTRDLNLSIRIISRYSEG